MGAMDESHQEVELTPELWAQLASRFAGGHALIWVHPTESGRRWIAECCCGYRSTTRTSFDLAHEAGVHHNRVMERQLRADGYRGKRHPYRVLSTTSVTGAA